MPTKRVASICLLTLSVSCLPIYLHAAPTGCQAAEPPEQVEQHQHSHGMDMNIPSGASDKCEPKFTYEEGLRGPGHWQGRSSGMASWRP